MSWLLSLINPRRACAARVTVVGLCVCVCVCVCLSATILALQAIYEAAYERYQQHGLEKQKGDFAETTAFERDKLARSRTTLRGPTHPISGAHACIDAINAAHLDLIRLLSVHWRHKKPQRRVCIDSHMLSTTVACELLAQANKPSPAHRACAVRRGFVL